MSERTFHAELTSREFPYNFRELSSTVVFNQGAEIQRGVPGGLQGAEAEKSFGVCQAYYLDNVLPISRGYSSLGFRAAIPAIGGPQNIIASFIIRGPNDAVALFVATINSAYVYDPNGGAWQQLNIGAASADKVSYGIIKEVTYIYFGYNIYVYNFESQQLEPQTLIGIGDISQLLGITSAGIYLVAWSIDTVYRSSVLNPLDFNPLEGLVTGAGATGVIAVKGGIVTCLALGQDFIIYTTKNAVSARQTGNLQFPFIYNEVTGSAGIQRVDHVAYNSNNENHVVWTASGFQQLSVEAAEYIFPELGDGITRGIYTALDPEFTIPQYYYSEEVQVKLTFVSNRWLVISTRAIPETSTSDYTDAFVYDTLLSRWGKLTIPHSGMLEYGIPEVFQQYTYDQFGIDYQFYEDIPDSLVYAQLGASDQVTTSSAGNNFGIVRSTGEVITASWSETSLGAGQQEVYGAARSRILFGKYKAFRTRGMIHQSLKVNRLIDANLTLYGHDYTGKYIAIKNDLEQNTKHTGQWFGRLNSDSITIGIDGKFILTDLSFLSTDSGKINQRYEELQALIVATTGVYPLYVPPEPTDCCTFTGPPMIYELTFNGEYNEMTEETPTARVDFECQECGDLCIWTLTPRGVNGCDFSGIHFPRNGSVTGGASNNAMYPADLVLQPVHRPVALGGVRIPLYTARLTTTDARNYIGNLLVSTDGVISFNSNINFADEFNGVLATPEFEVFRNPDGTVSSTGVWKIDREVS